MPRCLQTKRWPPFTAAIKRRDWDTVEAILEHPVEPDTSVAINTALAEAGWPDEVANTHHLRYPRDFANEYLVGVATTPDATATLNFLKRTNLIGSLIDPHRPIKRNRRLNIAGYFNSGADCVCESDPVR
jgi:hypothetical protein